MCPLATKVSLITRNLHDTVDLETLETILHERNLRVYWGTAIGSRPHISTFVPIIKIADFLRADCEVKILLADLHGHLANHKVPLDLIDNRTEYYEKVLVNMLESIGAPLGKLKFVRGTEIELDEKAMLCFYKLAGSTQIDVANDAGDEILKPTKHPLMGGLVYPLLQALDEEFLAVDAQLGATNQRKIFSFAEKCLPEIGYSKRIHLMHSMIQGLMGTKSATVQEDDTIIDILDGAKVVKKKISKAFCEPGNVEDNGVLPLVKHIIFPLFGKFDVDRLEKYGGPIHYDSYDQLEEDFSKSQLHPGDVKMGVEAYINRLLDPIRKNFEDPNLAAIAQKAYPAKSVNESKKKVEPSLFVTNQKSPEKLPLSFEHRSELIFRRLQEVLQSETLEKILHERNPRIYWGTATTGRPHVAYFVPMSKIADFLRADCEVTILLADLHGYLDNQKAPWNLLEARTQYYKAIIISMLKSIGVPISKLKFVRGTEFELTKEFSRDLFDLVSQTTLHDARKAGAEVVKQLQHPLIGSLLYPLLQALDEQYLECDAQFGGVDQRKIFTYAEKYLPSIGYAKRAHLMNPMVPGLSGGKMSSSEENSKIDLLDGPEAVKRKLLSASCDPTNTAENGILAFVEHVIMPLFNEFKVCESVDKSKYDSYDTLASDFVNGNIQASELRSGVEYYINRLLEPIRRDFQSAELVELSQRAYPKI